MDLSLTHAPIGQFVERPKTPKEWHKYQLAEAQVAAFHDNGYVAGIQILNEQQVGVLCSELEGLMNRPDSASNLFHEYHSNESQDPNAVLFHALGAWRTGPAFHDVLWSPSFLAPAAQLLGGAVRFWHDQLFCKPAHHGGVVAWHQDYSYWTRTEPMSHLTCWIALDDSDRNNGCLYYVPGSHRWKLLPVTGLTGDMDEIMTVLTPEQKQAFQPVPIELKRGQATFHHPLMVHGSYENRSERPRRATLINAFRDGVQSAADEPLLAGVPPIPIGSKVEGQFFPLLFDPGSPSSDPGLQAGRSN